jgi:serine/threonine-protein kinase
MRGTPLATRHASPGAVAVSDAPTPAGIRCRLCGTAIAAGFSFCSKCGAPVLAPTGKFDDLIESVRTLFAHELEIERELGRGGMAAVYSAHDVALQRRVAVKVLLPEYAQDEARAARFLREARTVAALQHPNVVSVYGVRSNSELSAIVMQFVDGRSLDVLLAEEPRLALPVAGLLLSQAAAGLQHAHDRGIIHRDVKPANVLVDHEGRAVVSDFGIALREGTTRLTDTGMVVGTMAYMSPEQRSGHVVGPAADQYALGVMAFELFAGRLPFTGAMPKMIAQHMHDAPPSLSALRPELASFVGNTVARMLEKNPEARFRDLHEPERVFRMLAPDEQTTTRILAVMSSVNAAAGRRATPAIPPPATRQSLPADVPAPPTRRKSTSRRLRKRLRPVAFAAAAFVVIAAGAWAWLSSSNDPTITGTPSNPTNSSSSAPATSQAEPAKAATSTLATALNPKPSAVAQPTTVPGAPAARSPATDFPVSPSTPVTAPSISPPSPSPAPATAPPAPSSAPASTATLTDARAAARQFVTMLNQHRASELELLASLDGDAALRTELVRLTRSAPDFAAGFERLGSLPSAAADGFTTDFVLDLEWRGGKRLVMVRLRAVPQGGTWRLTAFGLNAAE